MICPNCNMQAKNGTKHVKKERIVKDGRERVIESWSHHLCAFCGHPIAKSKKSRTNTEVPLEELISLMTKEQRNRLIDALVEE